jgi:Xaa-Pro dipeptidase
VALRRGLELHPISELIMRIETFQEILRNKDINGALLVQRADTLYFTGTGQNVHVYIPQKGKPVVLAYRDLERAQEECPWDVVPLTGISKLPQLITDAGYSIPKILGLEYDVLPVANFERYVKVFPDTKFVDISYPLRQQRAVKSKWEITQIIETGKIYSALLEYAPTVLHPGMSEIEFESLLEAKARILGHETMIRTRGFGFEFHLGGVVSGSRAAIPSYFDGPIAGLGASFAHPMGASRFPIQVSEPIIMDLALARDGYQIDTTRMLVLGELSREFQKAYETSLEIEEKIRQALIPGRVAGEVYDEILSWVQKETPYAENFMGFGSTQVRFLGHGIGLELDELPTISKGSKEILKPGMTISIEPKFVFPYEGAIGIEDTLVVEGKSGARYLCQAPRNIVRVNIS